MTPEPSRCLNGPIVGAVGRGLYSIATLGTLVALVLLALFSSGDAHAQGTATTDPPGANLDVSLFTFGPGEEVWERFGHNAIQIRDRSSGEAVLYNYGIFDFGQKNFFVNFARGLMTYRIAAGDPADELPVYVAEGRWIVEQKLNLTPAQRAQLAGFLANNARPENAEYRYDYFRANCSTRVRDALDAAAGGAIKAQTIAPSRGFTYRIDADRLMRPDPLVMLAMDAGLGPYADQRLSNWDESFVPMELMRHMREVRVVDEAGLPRPLVAAETRLADALAPEPPDYAPQWVWPALATGIAAGFVLLGLGLGRRMRERAWARAILATAVLTLSVVLGFAGIVLLALWGLTDHVSAWRNQNILLFNPLCLALLPCWFGAYHARWQPSRFAQRVAVLVAASAGLALFIKVLPAFPQDNRMWIALLLPVHLALSLLVLRAGVPEIKTGTGSR
jgi:hypothetical protein